MGRTKEVGVQECPKKGYGVAFSEAIKKIRRFLKEKSVSLSRMEGESSFRCTSGVVTHREKSFSLPYSPLLSQRIHG